MPASDRYQGTCTSISWWLTAKGGSSILLFYSTLCCPALPSVLTLTLTLGISPCACDAQVLRQKLAQLEEQEVEIGRLNVSVWSLGLAIQCHSLNEREYQSGPPFCHLGKGPHTFPASPLACGIPRRMPHVARMLHLPGWSQGGPDPTHPDPSPWLGQSNCGVTHPTSTMPPAPARGVCGGCTRVLRVTGTKSTGRRKPSSHKASPPLPAPMPPPFPSRGCALKMT